MVIFKGKQHCLIFLGCVAATRISLLDISWWFILGGCLGSYLPDADNKHAPIGKILPLWLFFDHREETHSLFFSLVCGCIAGVFNWLLGLGLITGMILHCFADLHTYYGQIDGLRYFWFPYKNEYKESSYKNRGA